MPAPLVCVRVAVRDTETAGRAVAAADAAGCTGIEECPGDAGGVELRIFAPQPAGAGMRRALVRELGGEARISHPEAVAEQDWSEAWREGLRPVVISERLVVAPSFAARGAAGEVIVDPRQAFGTGHHASTRLALELLDAELAARRSARVLDVGTGSGVLALAALRLGAARALGFDIDPVAVAEAGRNAARNGLADRAEWLAGGFEALGPAAFDVIVANLIRRELLPVLDPLVARLAPGGAVLLSGLLAADRAPVEAALGERGLCVRSERARRDGGDEWIALAAQGAAWAD